MDDPNRGPELVSITVVITAIAIAFTILRLYVRVKVIHKLGWDDLLIVLSTVPELYLPNFKRRSLTRIS